ncbi:FAD-dependent monooxygenase [Streptomyces sp. NPDC057579]|uniref:FAD-dependent monooxygenase n=1 Tax=Streptomyces sp. NPDC057579 TaxID=3346172 RepID=UPI0036AA01C5
MLASTTSFGVLPEDTGLTPEQVTAKRSQPLTLDDLRGILKRVAGTDYGLRNAVWISTAGNTTRHATQYRVNRVFVAGDAAHVHFPAGGQGVNVGMQDAINLAWKLAAETKGRATPLITHGAASYDRCIDHQAAVSLRRHAVAGLLLVLPGRRVSPSGQLSGRLGDCRAPRAGELSGYGAWSRCPHPACGQEREPELPEPPEPPSEGDEGR